MTYITRGNTSAVETALLNRKNITRHTLDLGWL